VRVWLFSSFRVSVGSRTIQDEEWRLRKAAALVKLLALAPGHRLHREQVMDLLWPNSSRKAASNSLRRVLHAARRTLNPAAGSRYLVSGDESLILCPESDLWIDVDAFEEAAATARRSRDPVAYRAATDLYAGELLPEDRYEEWAEERRGDLRRLHITLLVELAGLYEERGEYGPAIEALRSVFTEEPTNEEAHTGLMRLYALSGQPGQALSQYQRLRDTLSERLGAEPGAATRRLRDEIASGSLTLIPPTGPALEVSPDPSKHNLPAARTTFVGREREMLEVKRELAMTRLLTLTGTGGSGKTRLALEVARDLMGVYPDGVWLVELARHSEGDLVPQAVAGTLGVKERPGEPLTNTLIDHLRDRPTLLLLDNCEHLLEAVARLGDSLLDYCPRLRVLATSREPLGVMGESVRHLSPLSVPGTVGSSDVEGLTRYEAVRLFVDRARLRLPGFAVTPHNGAAVAEVCRRLGGIPLALELAAARVGTMSVEEIRRRIQDSLGLLSGGPRMAPSRQWTMQATLDWSYRLLSEDEKRLFRRLSVFAGGWTLEVAEVVGSRGNIQEGSVLDLLSGLAEKSLVTVDTTVGPATRYGMLEPIRQYARENLESSGEAEDAQRLHATFFQTLAEEAELKLDGPEEAEWIGRLEAEHDNLTAALSWALGGGDTALGLRLAGALPDYWLVRGRTGEGTRWLERALRVADDVAEPAARAATLAALGHFWSTEGNFERAESCLGEALALRRDLGDPLRLSDTLTNLGWIAERRGDRTRAAALFEESLETARHSNQPRAMAGALNGLGWTMADSGDFDRARRLWEEAVALNREAGYHSGVAMIFINLGFMEVALGNLDRATTVLEESLALGRRLGNRFVLGYALNVLGLAKTLGGDPNRGHELMVDALELAAEAELDRDTAENLEGLALAAGELEQHARAARLWGAAVAIRGADKEWYPLERMLYEPLLESARSRTDASIWDPAFAEGKAMGLEEAVAYALSEVEPATGAPTMPERPPANAQFVLTRREEEVASLVAGGLTYRRIAAELHISEHTVATHVRKVLKKLGLRSRSELTAWVTERRLRAADHP
jgi:predicted ATPase/DNA-binding SARP family transcriptional activator/DNA-binding CsgD family transcriptional regulator